MKVRVLVGIFAALIGIATLTVLWSPLPMAFLVVFAGIACYEILHAAQVKNMVLYVLGIAVSMFIPLNAVYGWLDEIGLPKEVWLTGYVFVLLCCMLAQYKKTKFEHIAIALYASLFIPFSFSTLLLVRNIYVDFPGHFQQSHSLFLVLCALTCAWITDTFAFFVGSKFGKHKLAPNISPKKSIEGAIGGVLGCILVNVIIFLVCDHFFFVWDTIKLWHVIVGTAVLSPISMLGDLSASVIKRNYGKKDFGAIMPGHGGIMDRFDSYSFVMPSMWIILTIATRSL